MTAGAIKISLQNRARCAGETKGYTCCEIPQIYFRSTGLTEVSPELETESNQPNVKLLMKWCRKLIALAVNFMKWHEIK